MICGCSRRPSARPPHGAALGPPVPPIPSRSPLCAFAQAHADRRYRAGSWPAAGGQTRRPSVGPPRLSILPPLAVAAPPPAHHRADGHHAGAPNARDHTMGASILQKPGRAGPDSTSAVACLRISSPSKRHEPLGPNPLRQLNLVASNWSSRACGPVPSRPARSKRSSTAPRNRRNPRRTGVDEDPRRRDRGSADLAAAPASRPRRRT